MSNQKYLHGYTDEEQQRLRDQNDILAKFIYKEINFTGVHNMLEVGCGVGAQMEYVLVHHPDIKITGVDIAAAQIRQAQSNLNQEVYKNRFELHNGDIRELRLGQTFDCLLLVWVLEHVTHPKKLLRESLKNISNKGRFYITEVNNQSLEIVGVDTSVMEVWNAMNEYQKSLGGNGNIGAELDDMLNNIDEVGDYQVNHRLMSWGHEDKAQRNEMLLYWIGLMKSSANTMIDAGVIKPSLWEAAQSTMLKACNQDDSSFSYAFVQATGIVSK